MVHLKQNNKQTNISFHGDEIVSTVNLLKNIIGQPQHIQNDGTGKVNYMWDCFTHDNIPFTIYDWKLYKPIGDFDLIKFHIGAENLKDSNHAKSCLAKIFERYVR